MKVDSNFLPSCGLNNDRAVSILLALDSFLNDFVDDCFDIDFNFTVFEGGV